MRSSLPRTGIAGLYDGIVGGGSFGCRNGGDERGEAEHGGDDE